MDNNERLVSLEKDVSFLKANEESAKAARTMAVHYVDEAIAKNNEAQFVKIENLFLKQENTLKSHFNHVNGKTRDELDIVRKRQDKAVWFLSGSSFSIGGFCLWAANKLGLL